MISLPGRLWRAGCPTTLLLLVGCPKATPAPQPATEPAAQPEPAPEAAPAAPAPVDPPPRDNPAFFPFRAGMNLGYVDPRAGGWAIAPTFLDARDFHEGVAPVCVPREAVDTSDGLLRTPDAMCWWGYVDAGGQLVVTPQYDGAERFSEGRAAVRHEDGDHAWFFVIDGTGQALTPPRYDRIEPYADGFARYRHPTELDGAAGYVDRTGTEVTWAVLADATDLRSFADGLAAVRTEAGWGFIDTSGAWVIQPSFAWVGDFGEGLAPAKEEHRIGWIDRTGAWVIPPATRHFAYAHSEGLARFTVNTPGGPRQGFIDRTGKVVAQPQLVTAMDLREGFAPIRATERGPWSYLDATGAGRHGGYTVAGWYRGGVAQVMFDGDTAWIDTDGQVLLRASALQE